MRQYFASMGLLAGLVLASGCSRIPDQFDVTRVEVMEIVRNIRCEVKRVASDYPGNHWMHGIPISYDFEFTTIEDNDNSGSAKFVIPISHGTFGLDLSAGMKATRTAKHTLKILERIDTRAGLTCGKAARSHSLAYPITGKIGMERIIRRFVAAGALEGVKVDPASSTLTFFLKFNAGAVPSVSIVPSIGRKTDPGLVLKAERSDQHKLLVTLTMPDVRTKVIKTQRSVVVEQKVPTADSKGFKTIKKRKTITTFKTLRVAPTGPLTPRELSELRREQERQRTLDLQGQIRDQLDRLERSR